MAAPKKPKTLSDIELHPDAWKRFETFVETKVPKRSAAKPKTTKPKRLKKA